MSDIVERLRQNAGPSGEWGELADRLQIEAADEIERLRADLATLKALLRPFAALPVEALGQCQRHPEAPVYGINGVSFTAMDVLRIRAALGDTE